MTKGKTNEFYGTFFFFFLQNLYMRNLSVYHFCGGIVLKNQRIKSSHSKSSRDIAVIRNFMVIEDLRLFL